MLTKHTIFTLSSLISNFNKMKNEELYVLYNGLKKCDKLSGVKIAYAIAKNKKVLFQEFQVIESLDAHKNQVKYEREGIELRKKCVEKDKNGEEKLNIKKYEEGMKELIEKNKKVQEEFNKLMKEENSLKFFTVKMEDIPNDITVEQMDAINCIIEK